MKSKGLSRMDVLNIHNQAKATAAKQGYTNNFEVVLCEHIETLEEQLTVKKAKEMNTMTIAEAFESAVAKTSIKFGKNDQQFAMVGWKSPSSGVVEGPTFITLSNDRAIEVDRQGQFVDVFSANAQHYFPWVGGK
jgi:hypothetical protein